MTARRNRRQRGAAVFLVVMVLTLLTAVGIFAIRSASLVNVASGHQRQAIQTGQLAEYAARATISELSHSESTKHYVDLVTTSNDSANPADNEKCFATRLSPGVECHPMLVADLLGAVRTRHPEPDRELLRLQTAEDEGSLGPPLTDDGDVTSALEGRFRVEMHDRFDGPLIPGSDASGANEVKSQELTLTTYAQLRMLGAGSGQWCPEDESLPSASVQGMRMHITLPAVPGG